MVTNQSFCPNREDYSPCNCSDGWIFCKNIMANEIRKVFELKDKRNNEIKEIDNIRLSILPIWDIPSNLLAKHRVRSQIELYCPAIDRVIQARQKGLIKIDSDSFSSSRNFTQEIQISACDIKHLSLKFLVGFLQLKSLVFRNVDKVHMANWTSLPLLPKLEKLVIIESTGMNEWSQFPNLANGLIHVDFERNDIGDIAMDRIMQWLIDSPTVDTLEYLRFNRNKLTSIPKHLSSFRSLAYIFMSNNAFNKTIHTGAFISQAAAIFQLILDSTGIEMMEPNAIQG